MSVIDELVQANERYAEGYDKGGLPAPPSRHVAVVTCMDARLIPSQMLGLDVGDAHVIRNAGGIDYLPFSDVRQSVRDDVALLRESPLVADDVVIRGFVYDESSGRVEEVS